MPGGARRRGTPARTGSCRDCGHAGAFAPSSRAARLELCPRCGGKLRLKPAQRPLTLSTRDYEASHGARPRGRGGWGFCPEADFRGGDYLDAVRWHAGTFSEARRKLEASARRGEVPGGPWVVCP